MILKRDDWDEDERRALEGVEQELQELRARHANDPIFELLRAADAGALPDSLQARLGPHVEHNAWTRALVGNDADAEPTLDAVAERRIRTRIERGIRTIPRTSWYRRRWLLPLAAAAILMVAVGVGVLRRSEPRQTAAPQPDSQADSTAPAAPVATVFALALDKPDVTLTSQVLVLRSAGRDTRFVDDIAPALNAYRSNDYAEAERAFASLQMRYPKSVEVAFYRGIAQLFLNDSQRAVDSLETARGLDDGALFSGNIAWYLAVALERAGEPVRARAELEGLCRQQGPYASRACDALPKLTSK